MELDEDGFYTKRTVNPDLDDEDEDEDEADLAELNTDENGHVIEGKPRKRNREDEYEPDFEEPEDSYGYDGDGSYDG